MVMVMLPLRARTTVGPPHEGQLAFHVFAALAEFTRELIFEGGSEGLDAARARRPGGMVGGRLQHLIARRRRVRFVVP